MEPARARWVFPCLDEPAYKAVFHITLIYPRGLVALANAMERPAVPVKYVFISSPISPITILPVESPGTGTAEKFCEQN
ncbi:unnamed protein product [Anisakis simplex]|uniref:Peptidase_M1_N domain-containing protein n=1 Tax=Anisakis simplex TaxID=6269 RepID=A0A0M3JQ46_ANISI|nr:unnamed protein product [Anisakis simplex]